MALGKRIVDVFFTPTNQTPAEHQGNTGRLVDARNVIVEKFDAGRRPARVKVQQRNGFQSKTTECRDPVTGEVIADASWANPELFAAQGEQPLSICNAVPRVDNGDAWTLYEHERVVANRLTENVYHTSNRTICATDSAWIAGVTCTVEVEQTYIAQPLVEVNLPRVTLHISFKGDDQAWVIPPRVLYQPGTTAHEDPFWAEDNISMARVVSDGERFWVAYNAVDTGTAILIIQAYDTSGVLLDSTQVLQAAPVASNVGYWDVTPQTDGCIVVQPVSNAADSGVVFTAAAYAGGITLTTNTDATVHCSGPVAWLTNDTGDGFKYIGTWEVSDGPSGPNWGYQVSIADLEQTHEFAYAGDVQLPDSITGFVVEGEADDEPTLFLAISELNNLASSAGPPNDPQLRYTLVRCCDWAGTVTDIRRINSLIQVSRAFKHDDEYYAITYYQSGSGLTTTQRTIAVDIEAGDYMIGAAEQPVAVATNDYVTGSPYALALAGTEANGFFSMFVTAYTNIEDIQAGDKVEIITAGSGIPTDIPDGVLLLKWTLADVQALGSGGAPTKGAWLDIAGSSIPSADGRWDIISGPSQGDAAGTPVYTTLGKYGGGSVFPGTFTHAGQCQIRRAVAYCAPFLSDYVAASDTDLLIGGTLVVTGLTGGNNGTFTPIRRMVSLPASYQSYDLGPAVWLEWTTQAPPFAGVSATGVISPPVPNQWSFASRPFDDSSLGADISVEGDVIWDDNNGQHEITSTSGGKAITAADTVLHPQYFRPPFPVVVVQLDTDIVPLTFFLQDITPDYTFLGALVSVSGSDIPANNGVYVITQVNDDGTFYAVPANGATGQVNQEFTDETITILFAAQTAPQYQPTWFMTPLRGDVPA